MKITEIEANNKTIDEIHPGDAFVCEGTLYMKTSKIIDSRNAVWNAVELKTGILAFVKTSARIDEVSAEINYKRV